MEKMIIRAKTFKAWFKTNLKDYAEDIANHGADCGYPGITYYTDTCALYNKFKDEIWEALINDAESYGQNVFKMIAGFSGAKNVSDVTTFENLMTWYMAERTAREITDGKNNL